MSGFQPKAGQRVYLRDGQVGRFITAANSQLLVQTFIDTETFDGERYEEDGPIIQVTEVFPVAPRATLDAEIVKLNETIDGLRVKIADQRKEISEFERKRSEREKHAEFASLDLFLQKKITHLVYEGDAVVYYKPFEKAIKESEDRHYSEMRLISLYGSSVGKLDWRINSYRDGSGEWKGIIPCQSEEEAREIALRRTAENIAAIYKIASSDGANYWQQKSVIDMVSEMDRRGYPVPDEARAMCADMAIKSAEHTVAHRREELAKAEAALAAVTTQQGIPA